MRIIELKKLILEASENLSKLQDALKDDPTSKGLYFTAQSMEKRKKELEVEFEEALQNTGHSVLRYSLLEENARVPISVFASTLQGFQELYSLVYDSVLNGVKKTAHLGRDVMNQSSLFYGYNYLSSLGTTLYIPNESMLFKTKLDHSFEYITDLMKLVSSKQLREYSQKLGSPIIRALFDWAHLHEELAYGIQLSWIKDGNMHQHTYTTEDFRNIARLIKDTSDDDLKEDTFEAILVGLDVAKKTFHAVYLEVSIKGRLAFEPTEAVPIPGRYLLNVLISKKTIFSTDQEVTKYTLQRIANITD